MADPFAQLGISRRPANRIFGTPEITERSAPLWSDATLRDVAGERAAQEEALAIEDERLARERSREAEAAADRFVRTPPSARERFFEETPALTGSKRFGEIAAFQKAQPSYADTRLANGVALKIADAEARQVFLDRVAQGLGTFAAKQEADNLIARKTGMAKLTAAGIHPNEAKRITEEEGYSPDIVNHHVYKAKEGTLFHKNPEAQAMENHLKVIKNRAAFELKQHGEVSPETEAQQLQIETLLADKYKEVYSPPGSVVPKPAPATSAEAKAALLKKLGLVKPKP